MLNEQALNGITLDGASSVPYVRGAALSTFNEFAYNTYPLNGGSGTVSWTLTATVTATTSAVRRIEKTVSLATVTLTGTVERVLHWCKTLTSTAVTATGLGPLKIVAVIRFVIVTPTVSFIRDIAKGIAATAITLTAKLICAMSLHKIVLMDGSGAIMAITRKEVRAIRSAVVSAPTVSLGKALAVVRAVSLFPVAVARKAIAKAVSAATVTVTVTKAYRLMVWHLARLTTLVSGATLLDRTTYLDSDSRTTYTDDE